MRALSIALLLFAGVAARCASLVETQTSQFGGGAYQQLSLRGVQQYCVEVLEASRYPNTMRLETVNRTYGVLARPDGSLQFVNVNAAVVENTAPNLRMAVRDAIHGARGTPALGGTVNRPPGPYAVVAACGNSLFWLSLAVEPRAGQRTSPVEIDPNPVNSLPPGWEKSIKKAEIHGSARDAPNSAKEAHAPMMGEPKTRNLPLAIPSWTSVDKMTNEEVDMLVP